MSIHTLKSWTELVKLHPDVESGALTEAVFAIDLGAIAENDPNQPVVYRDAEAFFKATYLTADLRKLLEEVLASLAGKKGYNRVLKLRTPFGGGKSHTLLALFHSARSRKALNVIPEAKGFSDPGKVLVAVFDGEKFDARNGKEIKLADGKTLQIRTMWGWLAWQLGEDKFKLVSEHDQDRVSPGGDVIKKMLSGEPKLILLDEVLKYMERSAAVAVLDSTLQRQAKDFFQNLTVEVAGSNNCALVYSLTWSKREALDNIALLEEIDKLAARVDQLREPVSGDEILPVLQRRLLGSLPSEDVVREVAEFYSGLVAKMWQAYGVKEAEEVGLKLRDRIKASYPFHPALIDLMRERWTSVEAFQHTRGALRFLASCLYALKKEGDASALVGAGEIPLKNVEVRVKMLKELGVQREYDPVIIADIEGPNARAKRIDERLAKETPALTNVKPATRLATAILAYSFGGLSREGSGEAETLPPGVTENELLSACVRPDLDNLTATAVLSELRNTCLYLHYDGVRYCFKKDPTVTKLIEDAEEEVARHPEEIRERILEMLYKRLEGHKEAIVWPEKSQDIPDEEPRFLVGYMPLEFASEPKAEQERKAKEIFANYGNKPRRYRNGLGLAIPEKKQIEPLRRAVRYLLAIDRVESKKNQLRLSKDQLDQLKERRRTEDAAAESAFRNLYSSVWLPRIENSELGIEKVEAGGRPLQAIGIHERVMELLTEVGTKKVHGKLMPHKIVERVKLGESISESEPPRLGIKIKDVLDAFFSILEPPRLDSDLTLRKAIVAGVAEGKFGYTSGTIPALGSDKKFQISRDKITIGETINEEEIDLDSGFLILPSAIPELPKPQAEEKFAESTGIPPTSPGTPTPSLERRARNFFQIKFKATRDKLFKVFPAIANLADKSDGGKVTIQVEATSKEGYDPSWLRNAVEEPLDEADVEKE